MNLLRSENCWCVIDGGRLAHPNLELLAFQHGYRVGDLSRKLGLTGRHFQRVFLRDVGIRPKEWMRMERMTMARRCLMRGMDPLALSEWLGFAHPNCFRREFSAFYGMTVTRFIELRNFRMDGAVTPESGKKVRRKASVVR